jgi:hypothetical protein
MHKQRLGYYLFLISLIGFTIGSPLGIHSKLEGCFKAEK